MFYSGHENMKFVCDYVNVQSKRSYISTVKRCKLGTKLDSEREVVPRTELCLYGLTNNGFYAYGLHVF